MRRNYLALIVAASLALAACSAAEVAGSTTEQPGPPAEPTPLIQIRSEGGFAPVELILANGPTYTVMSDGQLISPGAVTEIYPGPLVPPYWVRQLSEADMSLIMDLVREIRLPQIVDEFDDSAASFVADATTEVITYWDENGAHRYSVYALGIGSNPLNPDEPADPRTKAFRELFEMLGTLGLGDTTPYQPDSVRVIAGVPELGPDQQFADVRDWPFTDDSPTSWERVNQDWTCKVFGPELLDTFTEATQATTWTLGETEYKLLVRPLLPGEPDCPV